MAPRRASWGDSLCGIAGILAVGGAPFSVSDHLAPMAETLRHRGPDAGGTWTDSEVGVGLAHRRLSIVELSDRGSQPMLSHDGRFAIVYNGEIYNHLDLRKELSDEGHRPAWQGSSDTETLLECWTIWGGPRTLEKLVGMFAAGVWDSREKTLTLFRDRFGEKPLYYGVSKGSFVFASELKAFKKVPDFNLTISTDSVASFMRFGYVPSPHSIYSDVKKLTPGSWIEVRSGASGTAKILGPVEYWSAVSVAKEASKKMPRFPNDDEAISELDRILGRAVDSQMMGDVPVGAFLSGGIDSSLITALMQRNSSTPVSTFSIGSSDSDYNEATYAKAVAQHLGTNHTELYVSGSDSLKLIPKLPEIYDEPFADSSQIPTFLVSQLARRSVKVSLSGDGGDELFGGYSRYFQVAARWNLLRRVPRFARLGISMFAKQLPPETWNRLTEPIASAIWKKESLTRPGEKIHKVAGILSFTDSRDLYSRLVSLVDPAKILLPGSEHASAYDVDWPLESDLVHQMMMLDTLTYLQDDILVKVDRAAMANSLETRVPFLDHRVFEFAWSLPLGMKLRGGDGKWALRELLAQYVPPVLTNRPKMGFGVPIGIWLRFSLREWAADLLSPEKVISAGFLDSDKVNELWIQHLDGSRNHQYPLWNILMFQAWLEAEHNGLESCEERYKGSPR